MAAGSRNVDRATAAVAEELKIARTRKKLHDKRFTQPHVSELSGIPISTLKQIELGNAPIDMEQLFTLAKCLDTTAAEIVVNAESQLRPTADVIELPAESRAERAERLADDYLEGDSDEQAAARQGSDEYGRRTAEQDAVGEEPQNLGGAE